MARAARARRMALVAAGALALAGCSVPSNAPAGYDDGDVRGFFLEGCTGDVPETDGTTTTLASSNDCECALTVFEDMVPYDGDARADERYAGYPAEAPTFEDLDTSRADDPGTWDGLPQDVREAIDGCAGSSGEPSTSGTSGEPSTSDTSGEPSDATTADTAG